MSNRPQGPKKMADVFQHLLAKYGVGNLTARKELEIVWQAVAGEDLAKATRVGSCRRGVLEIEVASSPLLQELEGFRKGELLAALQSRLRHNHVTKLRFRKM